MIERFAAAKINLALHVTAQRGDFYHDIDTLVGFADIGDRLRFEEAPDGDFDLALDGPFGDELGAAGMAEGDNIVLRAATALSAAAQQAGFAPGGARITLEKNLPVSSGLGGGSADAAATLSGLFTLWNLPETFSCSAIAAGLGADVPMCLSGKPLRARGIGDRIDLLTGAGALHAVLVNPRVAVATPRVFAALANKANPAIGALPDDAFDPSFLDGLRNDLEAPARRLFPVIGTTLARLAGTEGCLLARMSGSGATCFGLYPDREAALAAHRSIVDTQDDWWSAPAIIAGTQPIGDKG